MNCSYCGTALPAGAMFCGECGRAVVQAAASKRIAVPRVTPQPSRRSTVVEAFDTPATVPAHQSTPSAPVLAPVPEIEEPAAEEPATASPVPEELAPVDALAVPEPAVPEPAASEPVESGPVCEQCGTPLGPDDIFCGECGYISRSASDSFSRPRDTVVIEALPLQDLAAALVVPPELPLVPPLAPPRADERGGNSGGKGDARAPFDDEDVEATRIVSQRKTGARFVLQFSTGESFTVYGTGLIGRNPQPEPAEYFDQLVRVFDPSKSVSKTHLEFGQDSGAFWIKDRHSGNGSIVREPDTDPVACYPERRYRIVRGTRVDIGEQFFVVS